jgi:hypothetical protein
MTVIVLEWSTDMGHITTLSSNVWKMIAKKLLLQREFTGGKVLRSRRAASGVVGFLPSIILDSV